MQDKAEEGSEEAGVSEVNHAYQQSSPSVDESTQNGEKIQDKEHTDSSSTSLPEGPQEKKEIEKYKPEVNPFLLTASYLVDVYASEVGVVNVPLIQFVISKGILFGEKSPFCTFVCSTYFKQMQTPLGPTQSVLIRGLTFHSYCLC